MNPALMSASMPLSTVFSSLDNLGHSPRMPRLTAPETYRGTRGSKREPALSAYGLRDCAARRHTAGYRQARSRVIWSRAAQARVPCPGTRHDVPQVCCDGSDVEPAGPRRCSRLTSARGDRRARAAIEAPGNRPVHVENDDHGSYKPPSTTEFLIEMFIPQHPRRARR